MRGVIDSLSFGEKKDRSEIQGVGFRIHHLGIAVANLEQALAFYRSTFGLTFVSGPFDDPIQKVRVCFVRSGEEERVLLELIAPLGDNSPSWIPIQGDRSIPCLLPSH